MKVIWLQSISFDGEINQFPYIAVMIAEFKKQFESNNIDVSHIKILATVSGGVDSVVLCYLLKELKVDFGIAHCNFQLRGKESDLDEQFVAHLAETLEVPFYSKKFNVDEYSKNHGVSTQMAARNLRYDWFESLLSQFKYDFMATAHHKNDNIETVLLNLVRGTGHSGLKGMTFLKGNIIRPMISISKESIMSFAVTQNIEWREDASNQSDKYKRNLVRNKIIPLFEELNPNFIQTFSANIEKFVEEDKVINNYFTLDKGRLVISSIKTSPSPLLTVWKWIENAGFTFSNAKDMLASLSGGSGKQFISKSHKIIKDRDAFILHALDAKHEEEIVVDKLGKYTIDSAQLEFSEVYMVDYSLGENVAFINSQNLRFPIKIRYWKEGDRFKPLGMKGSKLVSDFLIDQKVDLFEKEKQLVVEARDGIIWLVGRRISEDYKVFDESHVIKIELKSEN